MMDFIFGHDSLRLVEAVAPRVQVAVEKREVAAAELDAQPVFRGKSSCWLALAGR
jgi:hypothetical protein